MARPEADRCYAEVSDWDESVSANGISSNLEVCIRTYHGLVAEADLHQYSIKALMLLILQFNFSVYFLDTGTLM